MLVKAVAYQISTQKDIFGKDYTLQTKQEQENPKSPKQLTELATATTNSNSWRHPVTADLKLLKKLPEAIPVH